MIETGQPCLKVDKSHQVVLMTSFGENTMFDFVRNWLNP